MKKNFTWQQLGLIFEGQFGVTPKEAAKIISNEIFGRNWKHGIRNTAGRMWDDEDVIANFTQVLEEEDRLAKKFGRKNAVKELFKTDKLKIFFIIANLKYSKSGYKTFKNDYARWKKLKSFKNVWKKGKRISKKTHARLLRKISKADKVLKEILRRPLADRKKMLQGQEHTKKLIDAGDFEEVKNIYGDINLRRVPK